METGVAALSLKDIIRHTVRALLRRYHLNRDWIIGLIGDRGSGKSLGGANIAIRDFMMNGEPCWSNMQMKMQIEIDDKDKESFGLDENVVTYEAEHIDKNAFLALDSRYEGGCLFFDEFNLEYGEARRSASNVNLFTDRAIQQLRKIQCGLIYTVLNEMYVDPRIRDNTDVFIRCSDVAFNYMNLQGKMEQGVVFEWLLYPMSAKFAGNKMTYADTKKPLGPFQIQLKHIWDAIDTLERQAVGNTKYTESKTLMPVNIQENQDTIDDKNRWGWLDKAITNFYDEHKLDGDFIEVLSSELREDLQVPIEIWGTAMAQIHRRIKGIVVKGNGSKRFPTKFIIPNRILA